MLRNRGGGGWGLRMHLSVTGVGVPTVLSAGVSSVCLRGLIVQLDL